MTQKGGPTPFCPRPVDPTNGQVPSLEKNFHGSTCIVLKVLSHAEGPPQGSIHWFAPGKKTPMTRRLQLKLLRQENGQGRRER